MPTYEYSCKSCGLHFDVNHSYKEKPQISCPDCCFSPCHKEVTGCYFSISGASNITEMKKELAENYGMESISMMNGTFEDFYHGVKQDSNRIREEMKKNQEKKVVKPKKLQPLSEKTIANLKENKAKKDFQKRAISI